VGLGQSGAKSGAPIGLDPHILAEAIRRLPAEALQEIAKIIQMAKGDNS
jgi:hypothetical protein